MRLEVRLPATLKHTHDLHTGLVWLYDHEAGFVGVRSSLQASVGDPLEAQLELKGRRKLVYFEMAITAVGDRLSGGMTEFECQVTRLSDADRAGIEEWLPRPVGQPRRETPRAPIAPVSAPPPMPAPVMPIRSGPLGSRPRSVTAAPQGSARSPAREAPPDRTARANWSIGVISIRWSSFAAFAQEWSSHLRFGGALLPAGADAPEIGTICDATLFLPDESVIGVSASVVGRSAGQIAVDFAFGKAVRARLGAVALGADLPVPARA